MSAERQDLVAQLLHSVLEREPSQRAAFLDEACADDEPLRHEVEALLLSHEQAGSFLETPPADVASELLAAERADAMVGHCVGPFQIETLLGSGGMGEVYRATDTRLGRTVAVKILPARLSRNPGLRQRLEREARAISRLNHPNICTLYDIGRHEDQDYLVMEYLEGKTLEKRLTRGALPLDEALRCGVEIAGALQAAHRQGITHRDIKPSNIMLVRGGCKVLDFGLAKLIPAAASPSSPLTKSTQTANGMILGTVPYMAPEQLEGHAADARSDIFALGAVLYEMITGRRAFEGKSQATLIAAIMASDPAPIGVLQPMAPRALDHMVRRCLARDPEERWQSASDVQKELEWIAEGASEPLPAQPGVGSRRAWILAAIGGAVALAEGVRLLRHRIDDPTLPEPFLDEFYTPEGTVLSPVRLGGPAVSPDGSSIVVAAVRDGESSLYLRRWDSTELQPLPGTEDGCNPFWSPDNRRIGFFSLGKLKFASTTGGPVEEICNVSSPFGDAQGKGGTWNRDDVIVFAPVEGGPLKKVSLRGAIPEVVTTLDSSLGETRHHWPFFLPDGKHFIYLAAGRQTADEPKNAIYVGSLDPTEKRTLLLQNPNSSVIYASGHLLYVKNQILMAQPFDPRRLKEGKAVRVPTAIAPAEFTYRSLIAASDTGRLVYYGTDMSRVVRRDRKGRELWSSKDGRYPNIRLSPNGQKAAYITRLSAEPDQPPRKLWVLDLNTGQPTPYRADPPRPVRSLMFSTDNELVFSNNRVFRTKLDEDNPEVLVEDESFFLSALDVSVGGEFLLMLAQRKNNTTSQPTSLWYVRLPSKGPVTEKPKHFVEGQEGRFSPDGRWVAYTSGESGKQQILIREFPSGRRKTIVSEQGGRFPVWGDGGKEIVYLADNYVLTSVALEEKADSGLRRKGNPEGLFKVTGGLPGGEAGKTPWWDMTRDGKTFYVVEVRPTPIYVLHNWTAVLKS